MGAVVRSVLPLVAAITLSCLSTAPGHEELVSLTMVERAGVDRQGEWITMGVPLPKGRVKSSDDVVLLQDGRPTDAEILPVNRWWDDGTLRWVHLIFPAACPANGKASVTLALDREGTGQEHTVRARETDEGFAIDSGPLVFNVRKKGLNLIDAATVDGETVISPHGRGLGVCVEGKEFLASLDPNTCAALEEKGPLHAVIRATGSFRDTAGERRFDFDCRLYAYAGVARTHELRLFFHAGGANAKKLHGVFAGLQRPLRPFASPKWYCRDTQCLGDYCEAGGPELYGSYAEKVAKFDVAFERANRRSQTFRDSRTIKGVATDSYGFLAYGDGVHHVWTPGVNVPENIAWDGNYYGYPHMMCLQFLRTGNREYFDNFEAHALHVADVHVVHYTPRTHLTGGCRYCPPTDHVRIDPTDSGDYRTAKVYVSDLFNHHKVAGIIERWYFLRDHRSRNVAQTVLDYCYRWTYADNDFGQPRGPGTIMDFCYQGYMLTGERLWIDRAANVLRVHRGKDLNLSFQAGIFLEGMRRYYEMSGDEEAFNYIRNSCDRLIAGNKRGGVTAQAHSFLYRQTGDPKYLQAALDNLPQKGEFDNPWKNYALNMRNAALCLGDLHRIAQEQTAAKETQ